MLWAMKPEGRGSDEGTRLTALACSVAAAWQLRTSAAASEPCFRLACSSSCMASLSRSKLCSHATSCWYIVPDRSLFLKLYYISKGIGAHRGSSFMSDTIPVLRQ